MSAEANEHHLLGEHSEWKSASDICRLHNALQQNAGNYRTDERVSRRHSCSLQKCNSIELLVNSRQASANFSKSGSGECVRRYRRVRLEWSLGRRVRGRVVRLGRPYRQDGSFWRSSRSSDCLWRKAPTQIVLARTLGTGFNDATIFESTVVLVRSLQSLLSNFCIFSLHASYRIFVSIS